MPWSTSQEGSCVRYAHIGSFSTRIVEPEVEILEPPTHHVKDTFMGAGPARSISDEVMVDWQRHTKYEGGLPESTPLGEWFAQQAF